MNDLSGNETEYHNGNINIHKSEQENKDNETSIPQEHQEQFRHKYNQAIYKQRAEQILNILSAVDQKLTHSEEAPKELDHRISDHLYQITQYKRELEQLLGTSDTGEYDVYKDEFEMYITHMLNHIQHRYETLFCEWDSLIQERESKTQIDPEFQDELLWSNIKEKENMVSFYQKWNEQIGSGIDASKKNTTIQTMIIDKHYVAGVLETWKKVCEVQKTKKSKTTTKPQQRFDELDYYNWKEWHQAYIDQIKQSKSNFTQFFMDKEEYEQTIASIAKEYDRQYESLIKQIQEESTQNARFSPQGSIYIKRIEACYLAFWDEVFTTIDLLYPIEKKPSSKLRQIIKKIFFSRKIE